ncbi:MAG: hypothetical protein K0Q76_2808 [Panacagrimonas sp.]|jgi:uncharacterized protein|nr:hypothetical protein [Panacagrimonas sp.]
MSIPAQVSASRAVAREERYAGPVDPAGLDRLAEFEPRDISAELQVRVDVGRQGWLEGQVSGCLHLECRVCSERFAWSLNAPVRLALAMNEEQEERLMEQGEPVLVREDCLPLHQIVEDEVLLALPMMPRCPTCENARPPEGADAAPDPVDKPSPLAALKNLKLKH